MPRRLLELGVLLVLSGCSMLGPSAAHGPGDSGSAPGGAPGAAGSAQPAPAPPPYTAPPRQFRLGTASTALVAQAHAQANGADYGQASATIERALRIEPDNPLLWIELGRVRLAANDPAQADAMGHKALALATGDLAAQSSAWHLVADALRALRRNPEAAEAEERAKNLAAQ
jgi:tetratricopeptide (TPR) repeat protein